MDDGQRAYIAERFDTSEESVERLWAFMELIAMAEGANAVTLVSHWHSLWARGKVPAEVLERFAILGITFGEPPQPQPEAPLRQP